MAAQRHRACAAAAPWALTHPRHIPACSAARGSFRRPGSLDVARPASRDGSLAPASPRAGTPRQAEAHEASRSPSPPPQPQSPGRSAAAFVAAPHSRLSMDNSVKEALLCGSSF